MTSTTVSAPDKRSPLRFIWVIPVAIMLLTALGKIFRAPPLVANFEALNAVTWMLPFGLIQLTATVLFIIPKTRRVGFLLLMGYLGGIIATRALHDVNHVGIILGALLWVGMWFEDRGVFLGRGV